MYLVNKIVGAVLNPLGIGMLTLAIGLVVSGVRRFRWARFLPFLAFVWLWVWSTGAMGKWIGLALEREFPPQFAEAMPQADAIVVLGGGTGLDTNACPYAELFPAADRAWNAARLYKAGKAPKICVTCEGDVPFLVDLGVPRSAIEGPCNARNTEEEARFIAGAMKHVEKRGGGGQRNPSSCCQPQPSTSICTHPRVLLVTSAWHMRRALLMYARYAKGIEVVPAAADYETTVTLGRPLEIRDFVPDPVAFGHNACVFKEWIGYWGYRFLRK